MAYDGAFTPRQFPLDPFGPEPSGPPWSLDIAAFPDHVLLSKQRNVIVVLGDPPLDAIFPLLSSPILAASLLIIATSRTYSIPPNTLPAVRILRLAIPLASLDSDASSLAAVLQLADNTAAAWRINPRPPKLEISDETAINAPPQPEKRSSWFGLDPNKSAPPSPTSSDPALHRKHTAQKRSLPSSVIPFSIPTQRVFDAIFNFLPPDVSDRHLLKYAILVTTLTRPFLAAPDSDREPLPLHNSTSRRFNFRGRPSTAPKLSTCKTSQNPTQIVHLIPPARAALIRPLEAFCLSFSFPVRSDLDTPHAYVMPPAALADILHTQSRPWFLAELILCGAFDSKCAASPSGANRAWIDGVGDIILTRSKRSSHIPQELHQPPVMLQPRNSRLKKKSRGSEEVGVQPPPKSHQPPAQPGRRTSASAPARPHSLFLSTSLPTSATPSRWSTIRDSTSSTSSSPHPRRSNTAPAVAPAQTPPTASPSRNSILSVPPVPPVPGTTAETTARELPTPPSSDSSLPTEAQGDSEGILAVKREVKGEGKQEEGLAVSGAPPPPAPPPPQQNGTLPKRKRRGLLAWIKN